MMAINATSSKGWTPSVACEPTGRALEEPGSTEAPDVHVAGVDASPLGAVPNARLNPV